MVDPLPSYATYASTPDFRALSDTEMGDLYLRTGDAEAAIAAYQAHLAKSPGDAPVMRALGLAMLSAGRAGEAAEWIDSAYRADPTLASAPLDPAALGPEEDFRSTLELASAYANRVKTAPGWLSLGVLLQSAGRLEEASTMIGRAAASGLDPAVADRFRIALIS